MSPPKNRTKRSAKRSAKLHGDDPLPGYGYGGRGTEAREHRRQKREERRAEHLQIGWKIARRGGSLGDWAKAIGTSRVWCWKLADEHDAALGATFRENFVDGEPTAYRIAWVIWRLKQIAGYEAGLWSQNYVARMSGVDNAAISRWKKKHATYGALEALEDMLEEDEYRSFVKQLEEAEALPPSKQLHKRVYWGFVMYHKERDMFIAMLGEPPNLKRARDDGTTARGREKRSAKLASNESAPDVGPSSQNESVSDVGHESGIDVASDLN